MKHLLFYTCLLQLLHSNAADPLKSCWHKQGRQLADQALELRYTEDRHEFYHSFKPWETLDNHIKGTVWCSPSQFSRLDSLSTKSRTYASKTDYRNGELLALDYGEDKLRSITSGEAMDHIFQSARYSPLLLLNFFIKKGIKEENQGENEFASYTATINKSKVTLRISRTDDLLQSVEVLCADEMHGDVKTLFKYSNFIQVANVWHPGIIDVSKMNGRVTEQVSITEIELAEKIPALIIRPEGYKPAGPREKTPDVRTEKFSDHICFIELRHESERVLVAEFADFLLVEGAPLNSRNGELIIAAARKAFGGKPIRYFTFGHFHPHYLGGVRPFVHKGATVLTIKEDEDYVRYLASAKHTLDPDSLQHQPMQLRTEIIRDSATITDGTFSMKIFFIGERSGHTYDYLIYYFPGEKLLFEDDLVWIPKNGEIPKAGKMQEGLYDAIRDLGLDVSTVVQSWGLNSPKYKTVIPFNDIEKSVRLKRAAATE